MARIRLSYHTSTNSRGVRYYYVFRGGPRFWKSTDGREGSPAFIAAYNAALSEVDAKKPAKGGKTTRDGVDRWLTSPEFAGKGERTQADYRKWGLRFAEHFAGLPLAGWEDPRSRRDLVDWRDKWAHSPRQADHAVTGAVAFLNWARNRTEIVSHNCDAIPRLYKADRAEIVWTPEDVEKFMSVAPEAARRILTVSLETGLRPGDAIRLSRQHVENTPLGRRIVIRTSKRRRLAAIPVSEALGQVLDETPAGRLLILVSARGKPLVVNRASQFMGHWMREAGLRPELQWKDTRGTAATKLLRLGLSLGEIASHMGWSVRYAAAIIEHYATIAPELSDEILVKLERAKRGAP